jgi:hypothetical protein
MIIKADNDVPARLHQTADSHKGFFRVIGVMQHAAGDHNIHRPWPYGGHKKIHLQELRAFNAIPPREFNAQPQRGGRDIRSIQARQGAGRQKVSELPRSTTHLQNIGVQGNLVAQQTGKGAGFRPLHKGTHAVEAVVIGKGSFHIKVAHGVCDFGGVILRDGGWFIGI